MVSAGATATPPAVQDAQAAVPEGTPLKAVQAGRRNRSAPKKVAEPEVLHGERYIEVVQALLASATAGSTLGRPLAVQPH